MNWTDILNLGNLALNLFGNIQQKNAYRKQENFYKEQEEYNKFLGMFNASVVERTGEDTVYAIVQETKKNLSHAISEFSNRGITLDGSPMLVLGDIETMGEKQAQEAYFNAMVDKVNYVLGMNNAVSYSRNNAENARYNALSTTMQTAKDLMNGARLMSSMMKSDNPRNLSNSTLNRSYGPVGGITSTNSPLTAMFRRNNA